MNQEQRLFERYSGGKRFTPYKQIKEYAMFTEELISMRHMKLAGLHYYITTLQLHYYIISLARQPSKAFSMRWYKTQVEQRNYGRF